MFADGSWSDVADQARRAGWALLGESEPFGEGACRRVLRLDVHDKSLDSVLADEHGDDGD